MFSSDVDAQSLLFSEHGVCPTTVPAGPVSSGALRCGGHLLNGAIYGDGSNMVMPQLPFCGPEIGTFYRSNIIKTSTHFIDARVPGWWKSLLKVKLGSWCGRDHRLGTSSSKDVRLWAMLFRQG